MNASASTTRRIGIGAAGLGRAFMLMLPTFLAHPRVRLVAASDPRTEARAQFTKEFGGTAHQTIDSLCNDPAVEAIYIASPHQFHAEQVLAAARHGKHVLVEKPMALTIDECIRMNEAAERANIQLLVGHSHSFDAPFLRARAMIASGEVGAVRMITALNFTDFLYRPRRPEELITSEGGGVVYSQGAHQVDIVRLLAGGKAKSVRAQTGAWDRARPTEGAYSALITFDDGTFATLTYSGYAHYDSDELTGWIGEMGSPKDPANYGSARAGLRSGLSANEEAALKTTRAYGAMASPSASAPPPPAHNQFGMVIASCERADLRPLPNGVMVYGDARASLAELPPPVVPRGEVLDEFCDSIEGVRPTIHDGRWAMATLEACLAILESSRTGSEIQLSHQVALDDAAVRTQFGESAPGSIRS